MLRPRVCAARSLAPPLIHDPVAVVRFVVPPLGGKGRIPPQGGTTNPNRTALTGPCLRAWLAVAAAVALSGPAAAQVVFVGEFGSSGTGTGQFTTPTGVAVAPSGAAVYVVDVFRNRVLTFSPGGAFQAEFGTSG